MLRWTGCFVLVFMVGPGRGLALTRLGWLGVGDPVPCLDARSLSVGGAGLTSEDRGFVSISIGISSTCEETTLGERVNSLSIAYPTPPSLKLIVPLPGRFGFLLRTGEVFDYNYDAEKPIYDSLKEDTKIGVESVVGRGCLYAFSMGINGGVVEELRLGAQVLVLAGRRRQERISQYFDPALWGEDLREEERLFGLAGEVCGAARIGESDEVSCSYLSSQDLGTIHYPSVQSLELLHLFGGGGRPSVVLSLQRRGWSQTDEGFLNTVSLSMGSELWMKQGFPFRLSVSCEPWYGGKGIERMSVGLGTGFSVSRAWLDLGMRIGSRSYHAEGEEVNELLVRTLITANYLF